MGFGCCARKAQSAAGREFGWQLKKLLVKFLAAFEVFRCEPNPHTLITFRISLAANHVVA